MKTILVVLLLLISNCKNPLKGKSNSKHQAPSLQDIKSQKTPKDEPSPLGKTTDDSDLETPLQANIPTAFPSSNLINEVRQTFDLSSRHICMLSVSNQVFCWGDNSQHELGAINKTGAIFSTPQKFSSPELLLSVALADHESCGRTEKTVYCWGKQDLQFSGEFVDLVAGRQHFCGLTKLGRVYCWGSNESGQLGNSAALDENNGQFISETQTFSKIFTGEFHTCAITKAGELYCWGLNRSHQIDSGDKTIVPVPKLLESAGSIALGAAGLSHTCIVNQSDLKVARCWGDSRLAQTASSSQLSEGAVKVPDAITQLSAGSSHTCALTEKKKLLCWGSNLFFQIHGNDDGGVAQEAFEINLEDIISVRAQKYVTVAMNSNGKVFIWGTTLGLFRQELVLKTPTSY